MCDSKTLKQEARELAESDSICRLAKKLEYGHVVLLIQNHRVVQVNIEQKFR